MLGQEVKRPRGGARRHVRDEDLIQDMRIAAAACPRGELSVHRYNEIGRFTGPTVARHFGSWEAAMWLALPEVMGRRHPTTDQMLADLLRVAEKCRAIMAQSHELGYRELKVRRFTQRFYGAHGLYGYRYLLKHLAQAHFHVDTWAELRLAVGIDETGRKAQDA